MKNLYPLSLFIVFSLANWSLTNAQETPIGDWKVIKSIPDIKIANTTNDSGATVGVICLGAQETCLAYIYTGNTCVVGRSIPMLINSPVGAVPISTICQESPYSTKAAPSFINIIAESDLAKAAFESGGVIGFVFALKGGEFKALRFSTAGATAAIKDASTKPLEKNVTPKTGNKPAAQLL